MVYGVVRTADGVTPVTGLVVPFTLVTVVYATLGVVVAVLLGRLFLKTGDGHVG